MSDCPFIPRIHAYHDGEVSAAEEARLRIHLANCPACARELAQLQAQRARWQTLRAPVMPADLPAQVRQALAPYRRPAELVFQRWAWSLTGLAASILMACLLQLGWSSSLSAASSTLGPELAMETSWALRHNNDTAGSVSQEMQMAQWVVEDLSAQENASANNAGATQGGHS